MALKPDIEMMVVALDRYRAGLEDERTHLEKEMKETTEVDEMDGLADEISVLETQIDNISDAINALELI